MNAETEIPILEHTGEILSDINSRGKERPWEKHKTESQKLAQLFELAREQDESIISETRLQSLADCGSFLLFEKNKENTLRLNRANFCRLRLCPMCSWRKSLMLFGQVSKIVDEMFIEHATIRFIFVTLTVPNCQAQNLSETMDAMNKAFSYLVNKNHTFAPAKKFKKSLVGYMKAMEITYNQYTDTYHPHIHCLFAIHPRYFSGAGYIKKSEWQNIWSQAMHSEQELIVHVETLKNSTAKAIAEVGKYPVKPADLLSIEDQNKAVSALIVLHRALKKRRLVTFGGLLATIKRKLKMEDVDSENVNLTDEEQEHLFVPVEKVLFRWCKFGVFICD